MTSKEIENSAAYKYRPGSEPDNRFESLAKWLQEIAYQLAIINEKEDNEKKNEKKGD